jgi:hypothetical protein
MFDPEWYSPKDFIYGLVARHGFDDEIYEACP